MYPQQYKLTPAAYKAARNRILIAVPILLAAFTIPFVYKWSANPEHMSVDWTQLLVLGGMVVIFVIIRSWRLLQKQKIAYNEFELVIDHDRITGKNLMHQDIDLAWIEVTQIIKQANGSYILVGGPGNTAINIPADIENKEQLEASLNSISPVVANPVNWFTKYLKVIIGAVFALIILYIYSRNKIVICVIAPVLIAIFIWLYFNMRTTDGKQLRSVKQAITFAIIIIAILVKAFFVLSGRY